MMMSEFIERTGFEPTPDEYREIEKAYYNFDGEKDAFCKAFVEGGGEAKVYKARAEKIDQLKGELVESQKAHMAEIKKLNEQIKTLTAELDKELEWKLSENAGTNMEQDRYEQLALVGRKMTDQEAKEFIANECGFSVDKIVILHEVNTYERNKHCLLRVAETFDRDPVYESSDWNYICFDCASFMYELIDGELYFYSC
jgi:hypothetical protein